MAGRPRTPTNILKASGAFRKNPSRAESRKHEPQPNGPIGEPPSHLNDDEKAAWYEIVSLAPDGVLFKSDRLHLELAAKKLHQIRTIPCNADEYRLLNSMLGKMGLNPSDRSKVQAAPPKKGANPWDEFNTPN